MNKSKRETLGLIMHIKYEGSSLEAHMNVSLNVAEGDFLLHTGGLVWR